ncbi:hypothetical protein NK718_21540, partial [Alsobacter sp. SYSU M60028]|nr:hypothetical protein [Alsobacter ponti]
RPAPGVPLPPDRPFDLRGPAARPVAATAAPAPTPAAVPLPIPRSAMRMASAQSAGLFFAPAEPELTQGFSKSGPLGALIEQNFVPLKPDRG